MDLWERYGNLATQGKVGELLTLSHRLIAEGHPEANVIHAVALILCERYRDAMLFAESMNRSVEGSWPELVVSLAEAGLGIFPVRISKATETWARLLLEGNEAD